MGEFDDVPKSKIGHGMSLSQNLNFIEIAIIAI